MKSRLTSVSKFGHLLRVKSESAVDLHEKGLFLEDPTHHTWRDKGTQHVNGQEHARSQCGLDVTVGNILRVGGKFFVLEDECHNLGGHLMSRGMRICVQEIKAEKFTNALRQPPETYKVEGTIHLGRSAKLARENIECMSLAWRQWVQQRTELKVVMQMIRNQCGNVGRDIFCNKVLGRDTSGDPNVLHSSW